MKCKIEFDLANPDPTHPNEMSWLIVQLGQRIRMVELSQELKLGIDWPIMDYQGNRIGQVQIMDS